MSKKDDNKKICGATTKAGGRCKNSVPRGSQFCHLHSHESPIDAEASESKAEEEPIPNQPVTKATVQHYLDTGFVLTVKELRNTIEAIRERLQQTGPNKQMSESFSVCLFDGAVIDRMSLDDVLKLENFGTSRIRELEAKLCVEGTSGVASVEISFQDTDRDHRSHSISCRVNSPSRDWVALTSSTLLDRLQELRRPFAATVTQLRNSNAILGLMSVLTMAVAVLAGSLVLLDPTGLGPDEPIPLKNVIPRDELDFLLKDFDVEYRPALTLLERMKKSKPSEKQDAFDALILLESVKEEMRLEREEARIAWNKRVKDTIAKHAELSFEMIKEGKFKMDKPTLRPPLNLIHQLGIARWWPLILVILFFAVATPIFLRFQYPLCNFVWGGVSSEFERKQANVKFVFVVVIVGSIVSIVAGLFVNFVL